MTGFFTYYQIMNKRSIPILLVLIAAGSLNRSVAQSTAKISIIDRKPLESVLKRITALKPVTFYYNPADAATYHLPTSAQTGLIPAEVKQVLPELIVSYNHLLTSGKGATKSTSYESVNSGKLIILLLKAVQELQEQINHLKPQATYLPAESLYYDEGTLWHGRLMCVRPL